jgi:hypothetical protein
MVSSLILDFHQLKSLAKILTYCGILLTTALSIYSLRLETVIKSKNPLKPHKFTSAGRRYLAALLLSAILTIAASWIENYADGKLSDEANEKLQRGVQQELQKELGGQLTQFDQALADKQREVKNSLGGLSKSIQDATSELQKSVDSTTQTIQLNNLESQAAQRRLSQAVRDVQLSNVVVTSFFMRLELPGAKAAKTPLSEARRTSDDSKLKEVQDGACSFPGADITPSSSDNPCFNAFKTRKRWRETFEFFSYLDPMEHLEVNISFQLSSFAVNIMTLERPMRGGESIHDREFLIQRTNTPRPAHDPETWFGGSSSQSLLEVGFGQNDQEDITSGNGHESRESDLVTFKAPFKVSVCDRHEKSEDEKTIKNHLSMFPDRQTWKLTVIGFVKTTEEHPDNIVKEYLLEPKAKQQKRNCLTIDYR